MTNRWVPLVLCLQFFCWKINYSSQTMPFGQVMLENIFASSSVVVNCAWINLLLVCLLLLILIYLLHLGFIAFLQSLAWILSLVLKTPQQYSLHYCVCFFDCHILLDDKHVKMVFPVLSILSSLYFPRHHCLPVSD